jgi:hypothetical protein
MDGHEGAHPFSFFAVENLSDAVFTGCAAPGKSLLLFRPSVRIII